MEFKDAPGPEMTLVERIQTRTLLIEKLKRLGELELEYKNIKRVKEIEQQIAEETRLLEGDQAKLRK